MPQTAEERRRVWAHVMRDYSSARAVPKDGVKKPDLRAAIDAIDDEIDGVLLTLNQALPEPYKSAATRKQKISLLIYILQRDIGELETQEDQRGAPQGG